MAKQFLANRSGQTPTLDEVPNETIKIYDNKTDADLDLANIEENEIVATKAGESEGVVEVVDTVEADNPNAVSSGAVYEYVNNVQIVENNYTGSTGITVRLANIPLPANSLVRITFINSSVFSLSSLELRLDSNTAIDVKGLGNVFTWVTTSADILQVIGNPSSTGTWRYVIETRAL